MENKRLIISVGAPIVGDNVESVNGETGVVVLDGTDIETVEGSGVTIKQALDNIDTEDITNNDSTEFPGLANQYDINRSLRSRLISIKDYGAVGDGLTDDTAAFQAYEADANASEVLVPKGAYRIASNLDLDKYYRLPLDAYLLPDNGVQVAYRGYCLLDSEGKWIDLSNGGTEAADTGSTIDVIQEKASQTSARTKIFGFAGNTVDPTSGNSTVFGGATSNPHTIEANAPLSTIGGGYDNTIKENMIASTIAGGAHHIVNATHGSILGGTTINLNGAYSCAVAGFFNNIYSDYNFLGGGRNNEVGINDPDSSLGSDSALVGGASNKANGQYSFVGAGFTNEATNKGAVILGGNNNMATGQYSFVPTGATSQANGAYSHSEGSNCIVDSAYGYAHGQINRVTSDASYGWATGARARSFLIGLQAQASGNISSVGDAQTGVMTVRTQTTNATATNMGMQGGNQYMILENNSAWSFKISVIAKNTDNSGEAMSWHFEGAIIKENSAATVAFIGTPTETSYGTSPWTCVINAHTGNGSLRMMATGEAGKTINWVARVELTMITT